MLLIFRRCARFLNGILPFAGILLLLFIWLLPRVNSAIVSFLLSLMLAGAFFLLWREYKRRYIPQKPIAPSVKDARAAANRLLAMQKNERDDMLLQLCDGANAALIIAPDGILTARDILAREGETRVALCGLPDGGAQGVIALYKKSGVIFTPLDDILCYLRAHKDEQTPSIRQRWAALIGRVDPGACFKLAFYLCCLYIFTDLLCFLIPALFLAFWAPAARWLRASD